MRNQPRFIISNITLCFACSNRPSHAELKDDQSCCSCAASIKKRSAWGVHHASTPADYQDGDDDDPQTLLKSKEAFLASGWKEEAGKRTLCRSKPTSEGTGENLWTRSTKPRDNITPIAFPGFLKRFLAFNNFAFLARLNPSSTTWVDRPPRRCRRKSAKMSSCASKPHSTKACRI